MESHDYIPNDEEEDLDEEEIVDCEDDDISVGKDFPIPLEDEQTFLD